VAAMTAPHRLESAPDRAALSGRRGKPYQRSGAGSGRVLPNPNVGRAKNPSSLHLRPRYRLLLFGSASGIKRPSRQYRDRAKLNHERSKAHGAPWALLHFRMKALQGPYLCSCSPLGGAGAGTLCCAPVGRCGVCIVGRGCGCGAGRAGLCMLGRGVACGAGCTGGLTDCRSRGGCTGVCTLGRGEDCGVGRVGLWGPGRFWPCGVNRASGLFGRTPGCGRLMGFGLPMFPRPLCAG